VTEDRDHPHHSVYQFKRQFGGPMEAVTSGEVVLSRAKYTFQERVMMPVWKRFHPLYMRLAGAGGATVEA
jgi:hypothetical protein